MFIYFVALIVIKIIQNYDYCIPILEMFTYYVCLFCSHIVFNQMQLYATVIQVSVLFYSYKTGLIYNFLHQKVPYQVRNMTGVVHSFDVFDFLIMPIDDRFFVYDYFPWSSVFLLFTCYPYRVY